MLTLKQLIKKRKYIGTKGFVTDTLRYLSLPFTVLFYYIGLTGNQLTLIGTFFIFVPAYFISIGKSILGSILFIVWFMFDLCDGEVTRCRNEVSDKGRYLDLIYHDISLPVIYFALGMNAYLHFNNPLFIYLGFLASSFAYLTNIVGLNKYKYNLKKSQRNETRHSIVNIFNHPQKMMIYVLVLSLLGVLHYMIFFYFLLTFAIMIFKIKGELNETNLHLRT